MPVSPQSHARPPPGQSLASLMVPRSVVAEIWPHEMDVMRGDVDGTAGSGLRAGPESVTGLPGDPAPAGPGAPVAASEFWVLVWLALIFCAFLLVAVVLE